MINTCISEGIHCVVVRAYIVIIGGHIIYYKHSFQVPFHRHEDGFENCADTVKFFGFICDVKRFVEEDFN